MIQNLIQAKYFRLYHWTDERNLESIRTHGLLSLRELTARRIQPAAPGANEVSHELDAASPHALDSYVHLCMTADHPMAYHAKQRGHVKDVRYLSIDKQVLHREGVMFCDDVANKNGVVPIPIADAAKEADLLFLCQWNDYKSASVQERLKRAKRFEILVPTAIETAHVTDL